MNKNDEISEDDFNSFKAQIKDKVYHRPEKSCKVNM